MVSIYSMSMWTICSCISEKYWVVLCWPTSAGWSKLFGTASCKRVHLRYISANLEILLSLHIVNQAFVDPYHGIVRDFVDPNNRLVVHILQRQPPAGGEITCGAPSSAAAATSSPTNIKAEFSNPIFYVSQCFSKNNSRTSCSRVHTKKKIFLKKIHV